MKFPLLMKFHTPLKSHSLSHKQAYTHTHMLIFRLLCLTFLLSSALAAAAASPVSALNFPEWRVVVVVVGGRAGSQTGSALIKASCSFVLSAGQVWEGKVMHPTAAAEGCAADGAALDFTALQKEQKVHHSCWRSTSAFSSGQESDCIQPACVCCTSVHCDLTWFGMIKHD